MVGDIRNVIVIESLPNGETKTGEALYNDIIRRRIDYIQPAAIKMTHKYHWVNDRVAFMEILKYYGVNSSYMNGGVVFHFEMHGTIDKKGLKMADGSFVNWQELVVLLRAININTKNNLYITMATCFGRYLFTGVNFKEKSPYSGYISASKTVSEHEVIESFSTLYEVLTDSGNLVYSYLQLEEKGSDFYYKDSKATFNDNFDAFKVNPDFKKQITDAVRKTVEEQGLVMAEDDPRLNEIYDLCLDDAFKNYMKTFDF